MLKSFSIPKWVNKVEETKTKFIVNNDFEISKNTGKISNPKGNGLDYEFKQVIWYRDMLFKAGMLNCKRLKINKYKYIDR